jgi:hypothetical protein
MGTNPNADITEAITIGSVSDQDWYISRTHGIYHLPGCAKGQNCATLLITSRQDVVDMGDNRRFAVIIPARTIAEDLLQDLRDHGLFICVKERPTEQEIADATKRRDNYFRQLVGEADAMWARGHSFREISDLHRRAALALGIERDWAYVPMRQMECPACGEKLKLGVAVCRHCHAILDAEKAARHGLVPQRPSPEPSPAEISTSSFKSKETFGRKNPSSKEVQ